MKRTVFWTLFCLTLVALAAAGYLIEQKNALPVYGLFPEFRLTDKSGREISSSDLKGKTWIADFIFTRCSGQCPMMTEKMFELERDFKNIRFVSFTVDPEFDTPEKLSEYAKSTGAVSERWLFLTGPRQALDRVTTGLHMSKLGDPMMHSANFVLVDPAGRVRGYYDTNDLKRFDQLKKDIGRVGR